VDIDARAAFLEAASLAASVVGSTEVAAQWGAPSALAQLSVGGLAGHTYLACRLVIRTLDAPDPVGLRVMSASKGGLLGMRVDDDADLARDVHQQVRADGEYVARRGATAVAAKFDGLTTKLRIRLAHEPPDRHVRAPANDVAYRLDDWLANRTIEMLVHADDLAMSAGLDPLFLPADATRLAVQALVDISIQREGGLTLLRALSRRERQSTEVLRAL
jgi:hypothetical protein